MNADQIQIPLRARDGSIRAYAIVDASDANHVNRWKWSLSDGYAVRGTEVGGKYRSIGMHREILGLVHGDGLEGDHIDLDRLNNRRSNLRIIAKKSQQQNVPSHRDASSQYRGVYRDKRRGTWNATISIKGKSYALGRFGSEIEAAEVARAARNRLMPYAVEP